MQYFVVKYFQKPNGKYYEYVDVRKKVTDKIWAESSVILDFKNKKVIKLRILPESSSERDFDNIVAFYKNNGYGPIIEKIENGFALLNQVKEAISDNETVESNDNSM